MRQHELRYMALIGTGYVLGAALVKASMPFEDLTDFWVPAARLVLEGRPQEIYSIRKEIFGHAFPNAYPPVFFLLLTPFVALADALGLPYGGTDAFGASVVALPLLAADVALAALLCSAARERLVPGDRPWLFALVLVQPLLWFSTVRMLHHESMLLAALCGAVLCLERGRDGLAVALASLALTLKATALLALPALSIWAWREGRRRTALGLALGPPAALLVLLGPWLLYRPEATLGSLVRFELQRRSSLLAPAPRRRWSPARTRRCCCWAPCWRPGF
jgi:uncharacterized membrane protein